MPVYNVDQYIAESIESVINQTFTDWELIIVNDGSTDKTSDIAASFQDSRIKVITQENQGVSVARNNGILAASRAYVAFLDGDDLWSNDFLETMVRAKESTVEPIVYCGWYRFWDDGKEQHRQFPYLDGNILYDYIADTISIHVNTLLINRQFLLDTGVQFTPGCHFGEDNEFISKLLCHTPVISVPKAMMKYRSRVGSACGSGSSFRKSLDTIGKVERVNDYIYQKYRQADRERLLELGADRLCYERYRSILHAIREKEYNAALAALEDHPAIEIRGIYKNLHHRMKWAIINSKIQLLWKFL